MSRDVEVQYAPPLMGQHQEHVQNLEADSRPFKRGHLAARWFLPSFADKSAQRVVAGQLLPTWIFQICAEG